MANAQSHSTEFGPLPFARRAGEGGSQRVLADGEIGLVTIDSRGCISGGMLEAGGSFRK